MYKNSSAPSNNTELWHYLDTKHLDFWPENNGTPGVLIEEIRYLTFCVSYKSSVNFIEVPIVCCTSYKNFIDHPCLGKKL